MPFDAIIIAKRMASHKNTVSSPVMERFFEIRLKTWRIPSGIH
jgi:hypothetical protein